MKFSILLVLATISFSQMALSQTASRNGDGPGNNGIPNVNKPTTITEFQDSLNLECRVLGGSQGAKSIRFALCKGNDSVEYVVRQTTTSKKSKLKIKECAHGTYQPDSFYGDSLPKCSSGREVEMSY